MGVSELEKAVAELSPQELSAFRAWFDRFDQDRFDRAIQADATSGRLDRLAAEALDELRGGDLRQL